MRNMCHMPTLQYKYNVTYNNNVNIQRNRNPMINQLCLCAQIAVGALTSVNAELCGTIDGVVV